MKGLFRLDTKDVEIRRLRDELDGLHRLLWCAVREAGGEVRISLATTADMRPGASRVSVRERGLHLVLTAT